MRRLACLILAGLVIGASSVAAQAVDTILVGDSAVRANLLRLGTERVESYRLEDGEKTPLSTTMRSIGPGRAGNLDVFVIDATHASADGDTTVSSIVIRASDFSLLHQRVKGARDSAAVSVSEGHLTGWVVLPEQPIQLLDLEFDRPVFPIEGQMPWLFPMLPFESGYAATIPHFSPWAGEETWAPITVLASETIEHGGSRVVCWKVDTGPLGPPGYRGFHWIEQGTGRVLRSVLSGGKSQPEYWAVAR
ncbi:MAG: hypothetical protein HKM89_08250 [Gemmatimonadales bacterium]|nr:hypothetical protein [Gemmatimonadales bacterium]